MSKKSIIIISVLAVVIITALGAFLYFKGPRLENNLPEDLSGDQNQEQSLNRQEDMLEKMAEANRIAGVKPMSESERDEILDKMAEANKTSPMTEKEKAEILQKMKEAIQKQ